jgi:tRNA dimethylallyltransferase
MAERLGGEIIGADAFQIFSGLPVLTAQPGPDLTARVRHHLVGTIPPDGHCDAARYAVMARECIRDITSRGGLPIIVGGSGLYIRALACGLADIPPADPRLRLEISAIEPSDALARLREADPSAPAQIDAKNPARVRRALEIVLSTGKPLAASRSGWKSDGGGFRGIVLDRGTDGLRTRIRENVDAMFGRGVVDEVARFPCDSRAIGFREIRALIAGTVSERDCRSAVVRATWHYAKRQRTWCRHQFPFPIVRVDDDPDAACEAVLRPAG